MKLLSYTAYETEIYVTQGGHVRIQQFDVDCAERRDSTYVLLTPDQVDVIADRLRVFADEARVQKIKFDAEGGDE